MNSSANSGQTRLPRLPSLLERKIYKTGQTRGADDDVIFQNRVGRNSTILIPYLLWVKSYRTLASKTKFENGYIVLISPDLYWGSKDFPDEMTTQDLRLGTNALVFYETRNQWQLYDPDKLKWKPAKSRTSPLRGQYVARVPATTASDGGERIVRGFVDTSNKGAGIRVYEYAATETIKQCRFQLEALFWLCDDSENVASSEGMPAPDASIRKKAILTECSRQGLLEKENLLAARLINKRNVTVCPLCLEELSAAGFFSRMKQAEGRDVPDMTVTDISLFHVNELRAGIFNHCPYNLGWGHHHCNVVAKDSGIASTLNWMRTVLERNEKMT